MLVFLLSLQSLTQPDIRQQRAAKRLRVLGPRGWACLKTVTGLRDDVGGLQRPGRSGLHGVSGEVEGGELRNTQPPSLSTPQSSNTVLSLSTRPSSTHTIHHDLAHTDHALLRRAGRDAHGGQRRRPSCLHPVQLDRVCHSRRGQVSSHHRPCSEILDHASKRDHFSTVVDLLRCVAAVEQYGDFNRKALSTS
jgi:hypothetical protein